MRNQVIDNIRGLCLLGVIGIHVGSLAHHTDNFFLYTLFEVLSRYSVPTFFFVSGYGLFAADKQLLALAHGTPVPQDGFRFLPFIKKRLRSSALPYICWSLFYQIYFWFILPEGSIDLHPSQQLFVLSLGLGCYHLYFMVILMAFYLTHPLWRKLMELLLRTNILLGMTLLFILQLTLYHYSAHNNINPEPWLPLFRNLYVFRLNYLPLYYLFVYMCGGLLALYWSKVKSLLQRHFGAAIAFFLISLLYIEGSAYYSYAYKDFDLLSLAFTYHQLSPQGLIYTLGSITLFCALLQRLEDRPASAEITLLGSTHKFVQTLTKYSMLMYFTHPFFMDLMSSTLHALGIVLTSKKLSLFYWVLLVVTLLGSILLQKFFDRFKLLGLLFTGK